MTTGYSTLLSSVALSSTSFVFVTNRCMLLVTNLAIYSTFRLTGSVQLKQSFLQLKIFLLSSRVVTLVQSDDLWSLVSQYTHSLVFHCWSLDLVEKLLSLLKSLGCDFSGCLQSLSSDFSGFLSIHNRKASSNSTNHHFFRSGSVIVRSDPMPSYLSNVKRTFPATALNFSIVCRACT